MEQARAEQNRIILEEAENRHEQSTSNDDWWFSTTTTTSPSALLDTSSLLDTGIIDFESSPLFTAPTTSPPLLDNLVDYQFNNNANTELSDGENPTDPLDVATSDWSWLKEDKILEPISTSVLLSHRDYDEEEEESESEEETNTDNVRVIVLSEKQQEPHIPAMENSNNSLLVVLRKKEAEKDWITRIPTTTYRGKKRSRQDYDDDSIILPNSKRREICTST